MFTVLYWRLETLKNVCVFSSISNEKQVFIHLKTIVLTLFIHIQCIRKICIFAANSKI